MNFTETNEYRRLCCSECGVVYFFPDKWSETASREGKSWQCPNGHGQCYRESGYDKLRRERDRLKQEVARAEDDAHQNLELALHHERSAAAYKGQVTKIKKRTKAGVCACCNRTFQNLARHMQSKHPDMDPEEPLKVIEGGKR